MARSGFGIRLFRSSMLLRLTMANGRRGVGHCLPVGLFVRAWLLERNVSYLFGAVTWPDVGPLLLWRLPWAVRRGRTGPRVESGGLRQLSSSE